MTAETPSTSSGQARQCQNCEQDFTIDASDFAFYDRMKVPPPTWCPECRMQRRFSWRNERGLHKRECDFCGKPIIAAYRGDAGHKIYCNECWYSDRWDPFSHGRSYDFEKPFFVQFKELMGDVPLFSKLAYRNVNSEYVNWSGANKNCYLSFSAVDCEDVTYSSWINQSKNCLDCFMVVDADLLYECFNCKKCYRSAFLTNSRDCMNSMFLFDCVNCQDCFMSSNLRNKRFYFFNEPCSQEEYLKKLGEVSAGSHGGLERLRDTFRELCRDSLHKFAFLDKSKNVIGDNTSNSRDSKYVFFCDGLEEVKYSIRCFTLKESMDCTGAQGELIYEVQAPGMFPNYLVKFVSMNSGSDNSFQDYCVGCAGSSHLFGCVGLRNKEYCILNRHYTRESFDKLRMKIIEHMDTQPYVDAKGRTYRYGEFFPPELSPFAYNETIAQEYFPLTKEQALSRGFQWRDPEERNYEIQVSGRELPDRLEDVSDDIVDKVIGCAHQGKCSEQCTYAFKVVPRELAFYRKMNFPLPRLCPNCRHYQRLKQRNPLKLWHRKCQCAGTKSENGVYQNTAKHQHGDQPCPNEFQTSYAPERKEIVYCESCYNAEVV